ncbi:unnamed protein product, partial [marine sediment metagenome]
MGIINLSSAPLIIIIKEPHLKRTILKDQSLMGIVFGLIGGTMLTIGGLTQILSASGTYIFYINLIITLILGIIAIAGAALLIIGNQYGAYLLIIVGIIAIVEMLIPSISLISSFLYVDPLI